MGKWRKIKRQSGMTRWRPETQLKKKCMSRERRSEYQIEERQRHRHNSNGRQELAIALDRKDGVAASRETEELAEAERRKMADDMDRV